MNSLSIVRRDGCPCFVCGFFPAVFLDMANRRVTKWMTAFWSLSTRSCLADE